MIVTRNITTKECPWLDKDLDEGTTVFEYHGHTYGCITEPGIAVSFKPNDGPFFEIPMDAVRYGE